MKNKLLSIIITIILCISSILITNYSKEIIKNVDPIMIKINKEKDKFEIKPDNAIINKDEIIPGIIGKQVDIKKSYNKMKEYGNYNETLIVLKDNKPNISISKNYNKYIIKGNNNIKQISIILKIDSIDNLKIIKEYINKKHLSITYLISTDLLNEKEEIETINNNIELDFNKINDVFITSNSNYLESITTYKNKFCITNNKDKKLLNICKRLKMYTILPILIDNNYIHNIKTNLNNGSIIELYVNKELKDNLDYIFEYIKSRGYNIVNLNTITRE